MAKICTVIGFGVTEEVKPGIWTNKITEKKVYGDIIKNYRTIESNSQLNDNIDINNQISIVANPYIKQNFIYIKYIKIWDVAFKIKSIDVQYPRLIFTIGGEYHADDGSE